MGQHLRGQYWTSLWIQCVGEMAGVLAIGTVFLGLGTYPAARGQRAGRGCVAFSKIILQQHEFMFGK